MTCPSPMHIILSFTINSSFCTIIMCTSTLSRYYFIFSTISMISSIYSLTCPCPFMCSWIIIRSRWCSWITFIVTSCTYCILNTLCSCPSKSYVTFYSTCFSSHPWYSSIITSSYSLTCSCSIIYRISNLREFSCTIIC